MTMKSITLEQFMEFDPCYTEKQIKTIAGKKNNWTALDILNLKHIPSEDKLWAVLRPELIDDNIMHEFACRCAEGALKLIDNPDPRSIAAIKAKRDWIAGVISDDELDAANSAAWSAARSAASSAAWSAAWSAARSAAWSAANSVASSVASSAARSAAWSAAWSAANSVASSAAWSAAWDGQIKLLIDMLEV